MANTKTYTIQINGVQESINAVDALNKQLNTLESRINALQGKAVNVSSKGSSTSTSSLNEEGKLLKQIQQTEQKIVATRTESYQQLLAEKDLLKEAVNDQKERAAQERLVAGTYSNTMRGLKEELADIKQVMQTTDLADEKFKDLVGRAGQLTDKLKQLEAEYGQFGRNVGNYASAAEGFKNLEITVGNTVREFGSAREAFRTLGEELKALSINGQANTKHADELREAYNKLKSAMDDATLSSKAMDEAMDWMQSFTSMASVGQGFKGFFGIGGDDIQRSIQKLVSLQNVLQGIEKINKQIDSREGFGKYLGSINGSIDKVTNRLLAFNRYLLGTGQAAKMASVAIKGFGTVLKGVGIGLAITAISKLVEALSDLFSSSKKVEEQNKRLQQSFDVLTNKINRRNEALDAAQQAGLISEQEKLTAQFNNQMELLDKQVELLERRAALQGENIGIGSIKQGTSLLGGVDVFNSKISFTPNWGGAVDTVVNNMEELTTLYGRYTKALEEADRANEEWATALTLSGEEIRQNTEYYQNMRNQMEKMAFGHYVSEVQKIDKAYKDGRISAESYEKKMKDLEKAMEVDQAYQNALVHMKDLFGENAEAANALSKAIDNIFRSIQRGNISNLVNIKNALSGLSRMVKSDLENAYDDIDEWEKEQINNITGETEAAEEARTAIKVTAQLKRKKLLEEHQKEELDKQKEANEKALGASKKYADSENEIYQTMYSLRLKLMKDGLNKRLMQLDEEKRQTLNKLKKNSQEYIEAEKIYNDLRLKEIQDYQSKINEVLYKDKSKNQETALSNQIQEIENYIARLEKSVPKINELLTKNDLQELLMRGGYQVVMNYLSILDEALQIGYDNLSDEMKDYIDMMESNFKVELDTLRSYSNLETATLKDSFETRINDARDYYFTTLEMMTIAVEEERNLKEKQLDDQRNSERKAAAERYKEQKDEYQKELDAAQEEFDKLQEIANSGHTNLTNEQRELWKQYQDTILVNQEYIKQATENFTKELENIEKEHDNAIISLNLDTIDKRNSIQEKYFETQIANYRDFNSKINQEISKQPVFYKGGFEIINIGATRKNFDEIKDGIKTILKGIEEDKNELNAKWNEGLLTPETYSSTLRQLNDLERSTNEEFQQISENIKQAWGDWWGSIDKWLQEVGQAANSIMSSISEITSNHYDKQISEQEKYIEEYEKLLDKQKEATQDYADAVKNIEDELATARGDRRQQLIDALNAEMAAQRASLAEEKRIEKEKQKADDKKKELEKKQAEAEKRMSVYQAELNAVMAVSMAAVNKWPIPAIPMMAMAAAVGAAQIAAAKSKNIPTYGDGGVIQGRSHAEGGVKVLGGQAEVEGGEFITNKATTANNVELLQFINSKRKKIDVADLLEFYNSGKPAKNISSIRTKFANGGQLPSLRNDIDITDRMYQAMEDYANRPSVVQVVDIIDRTERLNEVKVISGLDV